MAVSKTEHANKDTVTLTDFELVKTANVSTGGQVYLGTKYEGETVKVAFKTVEQDEETEKIEADD
jgi:hypothetical protein